MSNGTEQREQAQRHLMAFAAESLSAWAGLPGGASRLGLPPETAGWLAGYRSLLGTGPPPSPGAPLLAIFSRIRDPDGRQDPEARYWPPRRLSLDSVPEAVPQPDAQRKGEAPAELWLGFAQEAQGVLALPAGAGEARFEAFTHLLHKWAWAVPCSYGEPGVSLYDEFRALSALVHASGCKPDPEDAFLLVGGDIPGIQDFVYTITSKGAAKGLRGRSFFVQLLGDAVVRRLLAELKLPEANVVYAAGGSFMLLAPQDRRDLVEETATHINKTLLTEMEGELALCLASEPLQPQDVGSASFADNASRDLMLEVARQKQRRYAQLLAEKPKDPPSPWEQVFGPWGQGGVRFCSVCQHERRKKETGKTIEGGWVCDQCLGFEQLAQAIAQEGTCMYAGPRPEAVEGDGWQGLFWRATGQWYQFAGEQQAHLAAATPGYHVNRLEPLSQTVSGYRLVANTTPRDENGQVRTFEELAAQDGGFERMGVLRMDVDDLGRVLTRWLTERTMASTSALSLGLDRFFSGWLDAVCREVMDKPGMAGVKAGRDNLLYTIYAGGDDLFVVGAWDLMPLLAERIEQKFAAYVGDNPYLHISAGIALVDPKFPLYQSAKQAGAALDRGAKESKRMVANQCLEKDAISFLAEVIGWERYPFVKGVAQTLVELVEEHGVPRSLLTTLRAIYTQHQEDVRRARARGVADEVVHYGPWMWQKVYHLSRTRQALSQPGQEEAAERIRELEIKVLTHENMPLVGLATRWAEYLMRGGQQT